MAVGINPNRQYSNELKEVLDYWITVYKTCARKIPTSPCFEGGIGGHALEYLRELYIEQNNCGASHMSVDNESSQLNVANFFIPIVAVGFAGVITICYVYWTIIRKIFRFSGGKPLDEVMKLLVDENQYVVKSTRFKTVHIVMLEEVY